MKIDEQDICLLIMTLADSIKHGSTGFQIPYDERLGLLMRILEGDDAGLIVREEETGDK